MFSRAGRAGITIDWAIAVATVLALALSILIGIRAGADRLAGAHLPTLAGISLLAPDDRLVAFQDFELGAPGWQGGHVDQSTPRFGGMLGRFGGTGGAESVSRSFAIADNADYAVVDFDLHAIDDWALEDVIVFANGVEVLRQNFTTRPDTLDMQRSLIADVPWVRARITGADARDRGFANGSEATLDQRLHIQLILIRPPEELRLGFGATLPAVGTDTASWAIDNLQIVTSKRMPGA